MLVTPKNGTACLTFTLVTVATAITHLTNNRFNSSNGSQWTRRYHGAESGPTPGTRPKQNPAKLRSCSHEGVSAAALEFALCPPHGAQYIQCSRRLAWGEK